MKASFGDKAYDMPTNTDLEKVLKQNLDHTNPLEMKEYTTSDGEKKLFPFWTPVKDPEINANDYKSYQDAKAKSLDIKKKTDNVGIVQPKDATKDYEDSSLLGKIKQLITNQQKAMTDKTGIVQAKAETMDSTKTSKQVTDNKVGEPKEVKVEKSAKSEGGKVGVVKPKSEGMPTKTATPETTNVTGEQKVVVEKSSSSKKEGKVGAVTPLKNEIKPDATGINFDKYKTDHIKK